MKCFLPTLVSFCPPGAQQCVRTILCSLLGILLVGSSCLGEETRDDQEGSVSREVRQVEPELYYVEDDLGRLIPVPGFRYRDFVDLVRLRDGLPVQAETPGVVLEQLRMNVTLPALTGSNVTYADVDYRRQPLGNQTQRSFPRGWLKAPLTTHHRLRHPRRRRHQLQESAGTKAEEALRDRVLWISIQLGHHAVIERRDDAASVGAVSITGCACSVLGHE